MDKKWNLQDIRPSEERRKRPITKASPSYTEESVKNERPKRTQRSSTRSQDKSNKKPFLLGAIVILFILVPGFVIGYLLDGAEITVHPRTREPNINATFEASKEATATELSYEIMTLEAEGERQVEATGEEEAEEQATGSITIYNTRSSSERLIKNTRFETPAGLVFRITESVVVPGAENASTPGSVRADVFADQPGEEYNISPSTFTVPGFKEGGYDELYASVTAKSETSMQGGFSGVKYIIDDSELTVAKDSLHEELEQALKTRVSEERPAGFVLFDSAISYSYESLPSTEAGGNMVTIKEKVLLHVPLFANTEFAGFLASATIPGYENQPVRIDDPSLLAFTYASTTVSDLRTVDTIEFKLAGKPRIVWTFDEEKLKNDLKGAAKTALPSVLSAYPAIERAEAIIRPFWKRTFPEDTDSITIVEKLSEEQ